VKTNSGKAETRERLTPQESSRRLFDTAYQLIAKGGVRSLSFGAIAKVAGCSRQLPHYHFGSKDAFLEALLDDCDRAFAEHMQSPLDEGLVGIPAVLALFNSLGKLLTDPKINRGRVLLIHELAGSESPQLRKRIRALHSMSHRRWVKILKTGLDPNQLGQFDDINALATLLHGAYRGISFQWVINPKSIDPEAVINQLQVLFLRCFPPSDLPPPFETEHSRKHN
jgi:AcrR family transcriptional regulator